MFNLQGRAMGKRQQVQAQLGRVDQAAMLALPVRLDLVEWAGQAFDLVEWDRECEAVAAS